MSEPFTHGSGFRVCGTVKAKFSSSAGTFGTLDIEYTQRDGHKSWNRLKTFSDTVVNELAQLTVGQTVEVTGEVGKEKLTNKDKSPVMQDGYQVYVPMLRLRTIKVDPSSHGAKEPESEPVDPLDGVPF